MPSLPSLWRRRVNSCCRKNIKVSMQINGTEIGMVAVQHIDPDEDRNGPSGGPAGLVRALADWSEELGRFGAKIFGPRGFLARELLEEGDWEDEAAHLFTTPFLYIPAIVIEPEYRRRGIGRHALRQLLSLPGLSDAICAFIWADPADKGLRRFFKRSRVSSLSNTEYYGLSKLIYTTDSDADGLD
ncbi:hypothetical protein BDZ89DRAFT_148734 [Hymenopellis radicata]|nr:hypothetical protein BDZ89DRAFT_148734 [Hymenopellis radicata]